MGKGKEKKEMERIDLLEDIRALPKGMQEELHEFAEKKLFKKANIKIRLKETVDNADTKNDIFPKRVIVDLDIKCEEDELKEYQDYLKYLHEAGAGILNYWLRYRFHVSTRHSRVFYDVLQQGDVFIDTNGQFQVDLPEDIKKWLANIFEYEKGNKPKISFMVEIIDLDKLKKFTEKLSEHINKKEQKSKSSAMPELKIHAEKGKFEYGEVKWGHKGARGKILKELMKKPLYENFAGDTKKEAKAVPIQTLYSVGFPKESKNNGTGFLHHPKKRNLNPDRAVRDAIEDIRGKLENIILQENQRMKLPEDYSPGEIKAVDNSFLLIIREK
jgi:hypothetical protein